MKKFVFIVFAIALAVGCKKAPPPPPLPPPPPPPVEKITQETWVKNVGNLPEVKNLDVGKFINVPINLDEVLASTEFATVEKFKSECNYKELSQLLKHGYLTVIWPADRPSLLLNWNNDLEEYQSVYKEYPGSKFLVLDPKPEYIVHVGEKLYWVTANGNIWKTW